MRTTILALIAVLFAPTVHGATITFDQLVDGGTVTHVGTDFVGTDILFEFASYQGTTVYCSTGLGADDPCLLNFDTAADVFELTSSSGLYDAAGTQLAGPLTLLTGTFEAFGGLGERTFFGVGFDTKHETLLTLLGVPLTTQWAFGNTEIFLVDGKVNEADLANISVAEPGLLALFGIGLVGLGRRFRSAVGRRRRETR